MYTVVTVETPLIGYGLPLNVTVPITFNDEVACAGIIPPLTTCPVNETVATALTVICGDATYPPTAEIVATALTVALASLIVPAE